MTKIDLLSMAAKKVWNLLRVFYFMLRKEISRRKLLSDLNHTLKPRKTIFSLITFNHHHYGQPAVYNDHGRAAEYEFSCSNSPAVGGYNHYPKKYLNSHFFSSFHIGGKRHVGGNHFHGFFGCTHLPKTAGDDDAEAIAADVASFGFDDAVVMAMIEDEEADRASEVASPMITGFGRTPLAKQLRITDSPFPLKDDGDGGKVDKAAEEFIQKFYRALQRQKSG